MPTNQSDPELKKLYPSLSDEELIVAEEKLVEYFAFAIRVYERIRKDPMEYARFRKIVAAQNRPGNIVNLKDDKNCRKRLEFDSPQVGRHFLIDVLRPKKPGK